MRVAVNGPPFGWSVVSTTRHGSSHEQEDLEPDRPLQRVDVALLAVAERHDAAARIALDVGADPLARTGEADVRDAGASCRPRR